MFRMVSSLIVLSVTTGATGATRAIHSKGAKPPTEKCVSPLKKPCLSGSEAA